MSVTAARPAVPVTNTDEARARAGRLLHATSGAWVEETIARNTDEGRAATVAGCRRATEKQAAVGGARPRPAHSGRPVYADAHRPAPCIGSVAASLEARHLTPARTDRPTWAAQARRSKIRINSTRCACVSRDRRRPNS